jgi:uncharacterized caspase-like protein
MVWGVVFVAAFGFWGVMPACAENYAVLAGVSHYALGERQPQMNLEGPAWDLPAMRTAIEQRGFAAGNIVLLLDEQATGKAILRALSAMVAKAGPGDFVLFYFSGHGTSGFDRNNLELATGIGPQTGALVPYDFSTASRSALLASLIIGRRDLRPILARLNSSAHALVILDSCYSQDASRDIAPRGRSRYLDLQELGTRGLVVEETEPAAESASTAAAGSLESVYPYANIVSLAAAARDETASDIGSGLLAEGRIHTIDSHPHGALTNSLLEGLSGAADTDHSGSISVDELYRYVREQVRARFRHTPQLLQQTGSTLASSMRFSRSRTAAAPGGTSRRDEPAATVDLKLQNVSPILAKRLMALPGIEQANLDYDLLLRKGVDGYDLFDGSRTLVRHFSASEDDSIVMRIGHERDLQQLFHWSFPGQDFNAALDLTDPPGQGMIYDGQHLKVTVRVDQPSYLLLLSIDSGGTVSVLYPAGEKEAEQLQAEVQTSVLEGVVGAPFGLESLKLFAFRERPAGYGALTCAVAADGAPSCPSFQPGSEQFNNLLVLLRQSGTGRAQAMLRLVSSQGPRL